MTLEQSRRRKSNRNTLLVGSRGTSLFDFIVVWVLASGRDAKVDMFNPEFDSRTENTQSGTEVAEEAQVPAVSWLQS
jgi:hypothetical protein